ncbi:MAG: endonuclease MutS2 [Cytophagaceae bacterium]|nr:endonuclease MutS2 [Cytophagaceae bacterium]MDW8455491.1 endonuclease MutS2 [Cytophagaceae bacterium]
MIYPESIEVKLGFNKIKELIAEHCWGSSAKGKVHQLSFTMDIQYISNQIDRIIEFKKIIAQNIPFPDKHYIDIEPYLHKLKPIGAYLEAEEFKQIKLALHTSYTCASFFLRNTDEYPALYDLCKHIQTDKKFYYKINSIIDDNGMVRDNASPELLELRQNLAHARQQLTKTTDKIMRFLIREGMADDELAPTIRNARLVVPVKSEYKRKIKGFIHDESATGQTTFIEPAEIFEMNNQIRELEIEEQKEVVRILKSLSEYIRSHVNEIKQLFDLLCEVDFLHANAAFALLIGACKPVMQKKATLKWQNAIHPLLYLNCKASSKEIVPLNIELNASQRIIIISGPNAGGKSVCLKTVGLLQYMWQCGLPVPMDESSTMGLFQDIFLDMGDEQSIENDLSTYSAHLTNMNYFLKMAGPQSLILIDEIGTGTEPHIGSAIAQAILDELNSLSVYGIVTTHFANLKSFAENTPGIVNGAMLYNLEKMEPTYVLQIGKPGSSYATEIAQKIGLRSALIDKAKQIAGSSSIEYDTLLKEIEKEKSQYISLIQEYKIKQEEINGLMNKYNELINDLQKNKNKYIHQAKTEARQLIEKTNQIIERTIREIKEQQADKEITKQLRTELEKFKNEELSVNESYDEQEQTDAANTTETNFSPGDTVRIKNSDAIGEIISIKDKEAEVLIGSLKSVIKINRLQKLTNKEKKSTEKRIAMSLDIHSKSLEFKPEIDIRGKRVDEALKEVEQLIDDSILLGIHTVRIIHGKGDGILRTAIRNHLKTFSQVAYAVDEHADRGGAGVTVVGIE